MTNDRDGYTCLVSGMPDPEAVPIFPCAHHHHHHPTTSTNSESETDIRKFYSLNILLQTFWGGRKAQPWRKLHEDPHHHHPFLSRLPLP